MKVFEKAGPANTDQVVEICKAASSRADHVVVASITGESAVKIAEKIRHQKVVCVTCPQGMWIMRSCASANMFHPFKGFRFIELLAKPGVALVPNLTVRYIR